MTDLLIEPAESPEGTEVHRKGNADVEGSSHPYGACLQTHETEDDARCDGGEGFGHGFAEVDHAIGYHHDEDGVGPEAAFDTVQQVASKEKLQTDELEKIGGLPNPKARP